MNNLNETRSTKHNVKNIKKFLENIDSWKTLSDPLPIVRVQINVFELKYRSQPTQRTNISGKKKPS